MTHCHPPADLSIVGLVLPLGCVCVPITSLCPSCLSGLCWALLTTYSWPPWDVLSAPAHEWEHVLFLCLARLLNVMSSSSIHAAADDRALRRVVEYCSCVCSGHVPFTPCWRALRWFQTLAAVDGAALKLGAVTGFILRGREPFRCSQAAYPQSPPWNAAFLCAHGFH